MIGEINIFNQNQLRKVLINKPSNITTLQIQSTQQLKPSYKMAKPTTKTTKLCLGVKQITTRLKQHQNTQKASKINEQHDYKTRIKKVVHACTQIPMKQY